MPTFCNINIKCIHYTVYIQYTYYIVLLYVPMYNSIILLIL